MAADAFISPTIALVSRLVAVPLCVMAVAACGPSATSPNESQGNGGNAGIFNNQSAADVIAAIQRAGLPAPNPRNVTTTDCPSIGCTEKIDTDTVSVAEFPTTGKAELYAGSTQHRFQIADIVVMFAPTVPPDQEQQYDQVVTREIQ